tara:strand:+ start:187 stop:459 length:273 start_codon:yes stop_codon:yes gene_type:complete
MSRFGDLVKGKVSTPTPAPVVEETPPRPEEEIAAAIENPDESDSIESDKEEVNFSEMSKKELEAYGRTLGVELDRRHSKRDLVKELKNAL